MNGQGDSMRKLLYLFVFLGVLFFDCALGNQAWCAGAEVKDVVATLEQGYRALNDVQAEFTQRTALASIKKEQRGYGTLMIKKPAGAPAMFRFNYAKPLQQIVSNGRTVWFYLPEQKQVMTSDMASMFQGQNGVTLNYLTGMDNVSKDYSASFVGSGLDKKGDFVLQLVPKKKSRVLAKLQVTVSADAVEKFMKDGRVHDLFPIVSSVVHDSFGTKTVLEFSKIRVNRGLGNSLFTFRIPQGVEVIKR